MNKLRNEPIRTSGIDSAKGGAKTIALVAALLVGGVVLWGIGRK